MKYPFVSTRLLAGFATLLASSALANASSIQSIADLYQEIESSRSLHFVDLEAQVWYRNSAEGKLVLHDSSGTAEVLLNFPNEQPKVGQTLRLRGQASVRSLGNRFDISPIAAADNDGLHGETERSSTLYLPAGKHAIRVEWFNAIGEPGLHVELSGPDMPRTPIPDELLFRRNGTRDNPIWEQGLDFKSVEGRWWAIPPSLHSAANSITGHSRNFDLSVSTKQEFLAIEYSGYIEIPRNGEYTFHILSDDGSRLFIGPPSLKLELLAPSLVAPAVAINPLQIRSENQANYLWGKIEGVVSRISKTDNYTTLTLDTATGSLDLELPTTNENATDQYLGKRVKATGVARASQALDGTQIFTTLLTPSQENIEIVPPKAYQTTITPIHEIEQLDRNLLKGNYVARIQGVVTNPIPGGYAAVVQGERRAIFVDLNQIKPGPLEQGELIEVAGIVDAGEFSPFINATELKRLGTGVMPTPLTPTRDEILNGSLHSQYVEIEGWVLTLTPRTLSLRTRAGVLNISIETDTSAEWLNSIVRLRGCLRSFWDPQTREIEVGKIELNSAEISIVRRAPADLFSISKKNASELLKFDPNASAFQRVALTGQVLQQQGELVYLLNHGHGVRASLRNPVAFEHGDVLEIAGFPEFNNPSPHFAAAVARKLGNEKLPPPYPLPRDVPLDDSLDSTLVTFEGELVGIGYQEERWSLQVRFGSHLVSAPISSSATAPPAFQIGSLLKLTGVYLGLGGNPSLGQPIEAFEILLSSPAAVQVLQTPPWWTMPRLLTLVGTLSVILLLALVWIKALQRQVAIRSKQLSQALEERHRIEQEEAVSKERSRLAYDLHDELGAGLTEVGLLGSLATNQALPSDKRSSHLQRLTDKVKGLVMSLDEIVWAVNPNYDSVSSFVDYYTSYASQFLELANVRCRFDVAEDLPEEPLGSRVRHSLFLAFKESLTNIARHAQASEVVIRIYSENTQLVLSISDNGCGLDLRDDKPARDGLDSIHDRLAQLGGICVVESGDKQGTTLRLKLPLK